MPELVAVDRPEDILPRYRGTPVGRLLAYQNLGAPLEPFERAELLVGMCMDNRQQLRLPGNFAFILRTSGANLRHNEFRASFAIGVGGVRSIALVAHTNCGMVDLPGKRERFVLGMVENAGWDVARAGEHFDRHSSVFGIRDEVGFVVAEAERLRGEYPKVLVAPLLYRIEDHRLYQVLEGPARVRSRRERV